MREAQYWTREFWAGLSLWDFVAGTLLGGLIGLALGIVCWVWLHRRGLLARHNRWHQWCLACYVVVLPLLFAFTGLQLGFAAGAQRALYKQIDHFQPHLQALVSSWQADFERSLNDPEMVALMHRDATVHQIVQEAVEAYVRENPIRGLDASEKNGVLNDWAARGLSYLRKALMSQLVEDSLVEHASGSGVDKRVFREALSMHMSELLHTRGVVRLLKVQISAAMPGIYFGLMLPWLLVMLLVLLEILSARRFGWLRQPCGAPVFGSV